MLLYINHIVVNLLIIFCVDRVHRFPKINGNIHSVRPKNMNMGMPDFKGRLQWKYIYVMYTFRRNLVCAYSFRLLLKFDEIFYNYYVQLNLGISIQKCQ